MHHTLSFPCVFSFHCTKHTHIHTGTLYTQKGSCCCRPSPPFAHNALTTHGRFTSAMGSYTRKADQAEGRTAPMYFSRTTAPEQCTSSRFCFLFEPTGGGARRVTRWILLYKAKRYKKQKKNENTTGHAFYTGLYNTRARATDFQHDVLGKVLFFLPRLAFVLCCNGCTPRLRAMSSRGEN